VTDGERLVWASSFSIVFDRGGNAVEASRAAARAIVKLREAAVLRDAGSLVISQIDERDFVDEIVSAP
jgi:hypothetical protein